MGMLCMGSLQDHLDHAYNRTDFSLDEGEQMLRQLDSVREHIQQLHARLLSLTDRYGVDPFRSAKEGVA